jgi:hypothetical protein
LGALLAAATLILCAPLTAQAAKTVTASTHLQIRAFESTADQVFVVGELKSENPLCLGNRRVPIRFKTAGGSIPFDNARTSDAGAWVGVRDIAEIIDQGPFTKATAKTKKTKVKLSKRKALVCRSASTSIPLDG